MVQRRSKMLYDTVCRLVGEGFTRDIYQTPMITALKARQKGNRLFSFLSDLHVRADRWPSNIPADTFADALFYVLHPPQISDTPNPISLDLIRKAVVARYKKEADNEVKNKERATFRDEHAKALLYLLADISAPMSSGFGRPIESEKNLAKAQIQKWYEHALDRTTGAYKRRTQIYLIFWALGAVLLLNADTLSIARTTYQEARAGSVPTAVAAAVALVAATPTPSSSPGSVAVSPVTEELSGAAKNAILADIKASDLPLGWKNPDWEKRLKNPADIGNKSFGLLITAIAVAQGAPFWFDLLSLLVNLRLTGPKPKAPSGQQQGKTGFGQ